MQLKLASAPVSWGIFEFEGIQPRFPWSQVLDEIAETGYTGTELGPYGYLPPEPDRLRDELERRGLQLLSAFVPVALAQREAHAKGLATALQVGKLLAALGARHLVLADDNGAIPELVQQAGRRTGSFLDPAGWDVFSDGVNLISGRLREELGLTVVFHHHCAGLVETPEETRALLERTEVGLCLDTGHWHYAGGDAVECLREFRGRIPYLHFKDCHPVIADQCRQQGRGYFEAVEAGVFCPLGEGAVDWTALYEELRRQHYDGWAVVEQDILVQDPEAPRRFARRNREFLAGLEAIK